MLEKCNEELEDEVEMKKAAYMDEIAELEVCESTDKRLIIKCEGPVVMQYINL